MVVVAPTGGFFSSLFYAFICLFVLGESASSTSPLQRRIKHQFINKQLAVCPAAQLPELQPAPCFLSAIIDQID